MLNYCLYLTFLAIVAEVSEVIYTLKPTRKKRILQR